MLETVCEWCVNLSVPVILLGSALYTAVARWRGRQLRSLGIRMASVHSVFVVRSALRVRAERKQRVARRAERVIAREMKRVGRLYDEPTVGAQSR